MVSYVCIIREIFKNMNGSKSKHFIFVCHNNLVLYSDCHLLCAVAKFEISDRMTKVTEPKNFYKTGGSKTYIPKNFYMKTTYSLLLSKKFKGSTGPSRPLKASLMIMRITIITKKYQTKFQM
ncbi:hypothetical protein Hanom_Chr04g00306041 [Helianthus anomalus]